MSDESLSCPPAVLHGNTHTSVAQRAGHLFYAGTTPRCHRMPGARIHQTTLGEHSAHSANVERPWQYQRRIASGQGNQRPAIPGMQFGDGHRVRGATKGGIGKGYSLCCVPILPGQVEGQLQGVQRTRSDLKVPIRFTSSHTRTQET